MVTQKKYDILKAMLIAQRKKNRLSESNDDTTLSNLIYTIIENQIVVSRQNAQQRAKDKAKIKIALSKDIASYGQIISTMPSDLMEQIITFNGPVGSGRGSMSSSQKKWAKQVGADEDILFSEDGYLSNTLEAVQYISSIGLSDR